MVSLNREEFFSVISQAFPGNATPSSPRRILPRCLANDMLKSSVYKVGPGCGNALRMFERNGIPDPDSTSWG